VDKAGKSYWDEVWAPGPLPEPVNPRLQGLASHTERVYHRYFVQAFCGMETQDRRLLEIGCARSRLLPYFAKEFGFAVTGLDYSELGCAQAREILERADVSGEIVHADAFDPPGNMLQSFDVVFSMGVVEHFQDTGACLASFGRFMKPGGMIITTIPNIAGSVGWLTRIMCRSIYDVHVPLDRKALFRGHLQAGLLVDCCTYLMGASWSVVNCSCIKSNMLHWLVSHALHNASKPFWVLDEIGLGIKPNKITSPYIACRARKPGLN
jgi:2-polyprenyl-3-methyl-5-hydroxy-6-metoxy-1,4-benzoquinol methylase